MSEDTESEDTDLAPRVAPAALALRADALEKARGYARASRSAATWRAYESDWRVFGAWCDAAALTALPASATTLAAFLSAEAADGRAPSTLQRRLAAIRLVHLAAGHPSPHDAIAVTEVMAGIRRAHGRPPARKAPAVDREIRSMVDTLDPTTTQGLRDRAVLLLGFAGAFRRSELVALAVSDLERRPEGLLVTIRRSKGDQEGEGQVVAILAQRGSPWCPVAAVEAWLRHAGITAGPVLRRVYRGGRVEVARPLSEQSVAGIVKRLAARVGLEPADYAGHSLRRGFLTSAARNRADLLKLLAQSRHRNVETVRGYIEDEERFENHAAEGLLSDGGRP